MALGERIRQFRAERNWPQTESEFADHISSDTRGIGRYESSRITPSLDTLVRIAGVFNVSLDHLHIDDVPRRPLHVDAPGLTEHLAQAHELAGDDRASLLNVLDALLTKTRVKAVTTDGEAS